MILKQEDVYVKMDIYTGQYCQIPLHYHIHVITVLMVIVVAVGKTKMGLLQGRNIVGYKKHL